MSFLKTLLQPRTLLLVLLGIGGFGLAAFLVSAAQPVEKPWEAADSPLLSGEVAGFEPSFPPRGAPELAVTDADGELAYLPSLLGGGRVTLVNLWASWCAPCLEELPSLAALERQTGARVLPVAQERRSEAQERAFEKAGVAGAFPILADPDLSLSRALGGGDAKLPLTVIFDERGREVGRLVGAADWSSAEAVRLVRSIQDGSADF